MTGNAAADRATKAIVRRVRQRRTEIGKAMIARYRSEIPDYAAHDEPALMADVMDVSLGNLDSLLDVAMGGGRFDEGALDGFRLAAARRVHQGVSIEGLLHAYRLWLEIVWTAILDAVSPQRAEETAAALALAGLVMDHLNVVSTASARAYVEELEGLWSDREVLLRDLLEEMLGGRGNSLRAADTALAVGVDLWDDYLVVLARRPVAAAPVGESTGHPLLAGRRVNRRAVDSARARLRPGRGTLLTGIRRDEVIALYPLIDDGAADRARAQTERFASTVASDGFSVGVGGPRRGRHEVSRSYEEAREAAIIAADAGTMGVAVAF
ncbi:MAG: hypothetical protein M3349_07640, partial [Actinomycetota bacterium]|nr:hypothetical protein [Actinomycetota bacterium]